MIDFTNAVQKNKTYAGANGGKISVLYDGEQYMLKFPPFPTINKEMSYTNSCISEYIGCKVFESVGIPVQETVIGTYTSKGKEKVVVACKDFTSQGITLQDFASLKNRIIDSETVTARSLQIFYQPLTNRQRWIPKHLKQGFGICLSWTL